jgi:Mg-chelatase subunit ChlD
MSDGAFDYDGGDGAPSEGGGSGGGQSGEPGEPGQLTAGEYDDNKNFARLQTSLDGLFAPLVARGSLPIADRVTITVTDGAGQPMSNARIAVRAGATSLVALPTGTDGRVLLFPMLDGFAGRGELTIDITSPAGTHSYPAPAGDAWTFAISGATRTEPTALDLAFVVDATGSMGDEIVYLKTEMQDIAQRVAARYPGASLRYSLIVYRDQGDEYVVRSFPFTSQLASFEADLAKQSAGGGGDYPEAAEAAMAAAMELGWREGNVARIVFHIADAPPHENNYGPFLMSATTARARAIRIFPVAASGVALEAEYLMRLSALVTLGRYVFLTDDSGIGAPHEPPHIPCYQVQYLNDLLVREIASELAGAYVAASPDDVLRTVGTYDNGVCGAVDTSAVP